MNAPLGAAGAQVAQPARRRRGDPRVEAVRAAVERLASSSRRSLDRRRSWRSSPSAARNAARPARAVEQLADELHPDRRRAAARARGSAPATCWTSVGGRERRDRVAVGDDARRRAGRRARRRGAAASATAPSSNACASSTASSARDHQLAVDVDVATRAIAVAQHAVRCSGGREPCRGRGARPRRRARAAPAARSACAAGGGIGSSRSATNALSVSCDQRQRQRAGLLAEQVVVVQRVLGDAGQDRAAALRDLLLGRPWSPRSGSVSAIAPFTTGSGESAVRTRSAAQDGVGAEDLRQRRVERLGSSPSARRLRRRSTSSGSAASRNGTSRSSTKPPRSGCHDASVATIGSSPYGWRPSRSAGSGPRPRTWSTQ